MVHARGYADTSLGQIHYVEAGEGPPIVLLHQTASSSVMYARAMPLLAANYRAIAIDTPGFGMSDPPSSSQDIIEHYADAVAGSWTISTSPRPTSSDSTPGDHRGRAATAHGPIGSSRS